MSDRRFADWDYEAFRRAALDDELDVYEKIGFPRAYREGFEDAILADIRGKLTNLDRPNQTVLDIGPGCSPLAMRWIELVRGRGHHLFLADSEEMLSQLAGASEFVALPGRFPAAQRDFLARYRERLDVVLAYSMLHYVFAEGSLHAFLDAAVELLAHGGQLLVGDIPNLSMRHRFFSSPAGREFHRAFSGSTEPPVVELGALRPGAIDDAVLMGLVARYRAAGYHAYIVPQAPELPMANRREDLMIVRP